MRETIFFVINAEQLQALKSGWQNLVETYGAATDLVGSLCNRLIEHYSEKGRAYHNLSHIKALLDVSVAYKTDIQNYQTVFFAIWFHDAIYNTQKTDNEEQSAELAVQTLAQLGVAEDTILLVQKMILATKHHRADDLPYDGKLFLDFDLSILGREAAIYKEYSQAIRLEYAWVPQDLYRQGRRQVLGSFLQREKIYYTEQLAGIFEAQARQNIESELAELAS
jgi:predicted metal-dependent HD superfamily phosphohydrolase